MKFCLVYSTLDFAKTTQVQKLFRPHFGMFSYFRFRCSLNLLLDIFRSLLTFSSESSSFTSSRRKIRVENRLLFPIRAFPFRGSDNGNENVIGVSLHPNGSVTSKNFIVRFMEKKWEHVFASATNYDSVTLLTRIAFQNVGKGSCAVLTPSKMALVSFSARKC